MRCATTGMGSAGCTLQARWPFLSDRSRLCCSGNIHQEMVSGIGSGGYVEFFMLLDSQSEGGVEH